MASPKENLAKSADFPFLLRDICALDRSRLHIILATRIYGILWNFFALFFNRILPKAGVTLDLYIVYS